MNKNILFLENFYTLLNSGYSVEESLKLCQYILNLSFIKKIEDKLKHGEDIYDILLQSSFPTIFKEYFSFFRNKNSLSEAIEKSLQIYKSQQTYKEMLKSKLTYPVILLVFLFLFSIFVELVLLPTVNDLFVSFQVQKSFFIQMIFTFFSIFPLLFIILISCLFFMIIQLYDGLKHKKFKMIEFYLKRKGISQLLQKYFSLKFVIYYYELSLEEVDSAQIIYILNQQMNESDLKIVLYELSNRLQDGESLEDALHDFEYFDSLFLTFFKMYIQNPQQQDSLKYYIQLTYQQLDQLISQVLKYMIPTIYGFVAIFVITIYISIIIPMMNIISDI